MRLGRIRIRNFRSFHDVKFDFGSMRQATVSGDNGAGKSTLIVDAPLWALFGRAHADLDSVVGRFGDSACVDLEVESGGVSYLITRTRKRAGSSGLRVMFDEGDGEWKPVATGAADAQTFIEQQVLKGRGYRELVSSVYMVQGRHSEFTSASQADAKDVFARLLALDKWKERSAHVHEKARETAAKVTSLKVTLENVPEFDMSQLNRLTTIEDDIYDEQMRMDTLTQNMVVARTELARVDDVRAELPTLINEREALVRERNTMMDSMVWLESELAELNDDDKMAEREVCPTCGQKLGTKKSRMELRAQLEAQLREKHVTQAAAMTKLDKQLLALNKRIADDENVVKGNESKLRVLDEMQAGYDTARERHGVLLSEKASLVAAQNESVRREQLHAELLDAESVLASYVSADRAFGRDGIPSYLMDVAIPQVEDTTNELLSMMTDGSMSVRIETQRALKSGGTKDSLDIVVSDGLTERPFYTFSGGEGFRINFALRVALAEVVAQRSGLDLSMLVVDEPEGLDASGREHLLDCLSAVSARFDTVLLISHHEDLRESLPQHVVVRKGADGSTVAVTE